MGKFSSSHPQVKKTKTLSKSSSPPVSYQAARWASFPLCLSLLCHLILSRVRALKVATVSHHAIKCLLKIAKNIKINQIRKKIRKDKEIASAENNESAATARAEIKNYIQEMKVEFSQSLFSLSLFLSLSLSLSLCLSVSLSLCLSVSLSLSLSVSTCGCR
jgi:hypothetical protein